MTNNQRCRKFRKNFRESTRKRLKINRLQEAINKKDSVTLAIVSSLKKSVGINDLILKLMLKKSSFYFNADKLLFKSGIMLSLKKQNCIEKVTKVINDKPDFEAMIEGHTDNRPYSNGVLIDNWDLSVKRSTSIIRVLQTMKVSFSINCSGTK